jgi:hypothetical protein
MILINSAATIDLEIKQIQNGIFLLINALGAIYLVWERNSIRARLIKYVGYGAVIILAIGFFSQLTRDIIYPYLVLYFLTISSQVYFDILNAKNVDAKVLTAVFCGFILLGYIATFSANAIIQVDPEAFKGVINYENRFDDLTYASFITILTIGYGDITPVSDIAKVWAIIFGLIGNFYTVIVTGIVIGKYLKD